MTMNFPEFTASQPDDSPRGKDKSLSCQRGCTACASPSCLCSSHNTITQTDGEPWQELMKAFGCFSLGSPREEITNLSDIKSVYLSGPMTGLPLHNFCAFHDAADQLRIMGFDVWSPAEKDEQAGFNPAKDPPRDKQECMREDLPAVIRSDAVVVLPGWEESDGAVKEVLVARWCGRPVLSFPGLEPVA